MVSSRSPTLFVVCAITLLCSVVLAAPPAPHRPIVLWHGMGDSCCNPESMGAVKAFLEEELPGVYVRSIMIGDNEEEDRRAGFFGVVKDHVERVCEELRADPNLRAGFNAIGFSQGGQFFRSYVERCNDPAVHNLLTFGSQHAGVSEWPGCKDEHDATCTLARALLLKGAYLHWVQRRVVQAQYYKDMKNEEAYLEKNIFLPDLNNEKGVKNEGYKKNLMSLNKLVLIMFESDQTVVPKETSWFAYWNATGSLIPLHDQPLYKQDWLGLQEMDKKGQLVFDKITGAHMQIDIEYLRNTVVPKYLKDDKWGKDEEDVVVEAPRIVVQA
ncbi:palmitoyl protein thioesterase [Fimicolochytrium jonesii]|uniref:palmitoyl protein thioesterase n=1 Tax=Fimicolochytrium jonesii TaxID=1396493 RepID=UPI0022FDD540|nr:palmitoyl protein thioesterase [Fimicolochytrium jonesii]KAI8825926.1 palmitoyl protein thioesterase [Fimicolochytrium jonesii]